MLSAALMLSGGRVEAGRGNGKERPWKASVSATWDNVFNGLFAPPATFAGGGTSSHLGRIHQQGALILQPTPDPDVFAGHGVVTFTAANGDELTFQYEGLLYAATGRGVGTLVFTGGTGRFADASGTGRFEARIDTSVPTNQPMTVELQGRLSY